MTEADPVQSLKTRIIAAGLGTHVVLGGIMLGLFPGMMTPETFQATLETIQGTGINLLLKLIALAFCSAWLTLDARQLQIRRPWWLNFGINRCSSRSSSRTTCTRRARRGSAGRRSSPISASISAQSSR